MRAFNTLLSLALFALPAAAQCEIALPQTQPPFVPAGKGDLQGDVLVLAAYERFVVFEREPAGWQQSASVELEVFGVSEPLRVALSGDRLAVAAPEDGPIVGDWRGSVLVYDRSDAWQSPVRVVPDAPDPEDHLGWSLDLAGDVLVAGAPGQIAFLGGGPVPGHALVFELVETEWKQVADLHPHDQGTTESTWYATSIATDGRTIAVSARSDQQAGQYTGAVYVYERLPEGWVEVAKLLAPAPQGAVAFGNSVAVEGATLAICDSEKLHLYERTAGGWQLDQVLPPAGGSYLTHSFGFAVALHGDDLVVGAPSVDVPFGPNNVGALHVYRRGPAGWEPVEALLADDAPAGAWFGRAVAVDRGTALWVGLVQEARLLDLGIGSVRAVCAGSASSVGAPAGLRASGCDSLLADELALALLGAPAEQATWLRVATSAASTPFGNGTLCLGGAVALLAVGATDAQGAWSVALDLAAPPFATWNPGDVAFFQAGFRDTGFGAGFGTSDAVALVLQP